MGDPFHDRAVPRPILLAAAALVSVTLAAAALSRLAGVGRFAPPARPAAAERALQFEDLADGGVRVLDAHSGAAIATLAPGGDGFVRATLRALVRERRLGGQSHRAPFLLARAADGRLSLHDPATGRGIDLGAFGPTNAAAFERLLAPATAGTGTNTDTGTDSGTAPRGGASRAARASHPQEPS